MIIETENLTLAQLVRVYLAITKQTHEDAAIKFKISKDTFRDLLRNRERKNEGRFRNIIEVDLKTNYKYVCR